MGSVDDNEGGMMWDASAQGWVYTCGRQTPLKHEFSPPMSTLEVKLICEAAANGTEQAWHNAHPPAVKTWLQNRTQTQRARHLEGCQMMHAYRTAA